MLEIRTVQTVDVRALFYIRHCSFASVHCHVRLI
jgi:hypothetical protein